MNDKDPITRVSEPLRPTRRKWSFWRVIIRMFGLIFMFAVILTGAIVWAGYEFAAPGPLAAKKIVQIPKTADRMAIATLLQKEGVISDTRLFSVMALLDEQLRHAHLRTGEYDFPARARMSDVLSMLSRGEFVKYKVTIPEGWTSQMVVNRLDEQEELDGQVSATPAEGTLLPETYIVTRGYTRDRLLADMAAAQNKLLEGVAARIPPGSPLKTTEDVVTMASIVEKETGVAEERPEVAAVFINRMKQHMRLQSDPTVIYGIVGGKGKLDRPITRDDLEGDTPYNTYVIDGLPPGPIANPGKAAIEAVLNPANVPYLYFVANGAGGHAFATTLDEHNANVKKWRSLNGASEAAPEAKPAPAIVPVPTPAPAPASTSPKPAPLSNVITTPDATTPDAPTSAKGKPKLKLKKPKLP